MKHLLRPFQIVGFLLVFCLITDPALAAIATTSSTNVQPFSRHASLFNEQALQLETYGAQFRKYLQPWNRFWVIRVIQWTLRERSEDRSLSSYLSGALRKGDIDDADLRHALQRLESVLKEPKVYNPGSNLEPRQIVENLQAAESAGYLRVVGNGVIEFLPIPLDSLPLYLEHFGPIADRRSRVLDKPSRAKATIVRISGMTGFGHTRRGILSTISARKLFRRRLLYLDPRSLLYPPGDFDYGRSFIFSGEIPRGAITEKITLAAEDQGQFYFKLNAERIANYEALHQQGLVPEDQDQLKRKLDYLEQQFWAAISLRFPLPQAPSSVIPFTAKVLRMFVWLAAAMKQSLPLLRAPSYAMKVLRMFVWLVVSTAFLGGSAAARPPQVFPPSPHSYFTSA